VTKYATVVALSAGFFGTLYILMPRILGRILKIPAYLKHDFAGRWNIENELVCFVHNLLSAILSVEAALYTCSDSDKYPVTDSTWTVLRYFDSRTCSHQASERFTIPILFTLGFFFVDIIMMLLRLGHKKDEKEMLLHHFCSGSCLILSLFAGYGTLGGSNAFLMSEMSTIFLKFCYLFPKDQQTSPLCLTSFVLFLVSFTVLRIYLHPKMLVMAFYDTATMWD
jgi:hypothetical protein